MSRSLVLCLLTAMPAAVLPWGVVRADDGGTLAFGNENITASLKVHAGHLTLNAVENKQVSASLAPGELFTLTLEDGREIHSSAMRLSGKLEKSAIAPDDGAARPAARKAGQQLCADMEDEARLTGA
jgi:hypothetical protein